MTAEVAQATTVAHARTTDVVIGRRAKTATPVLVHLVAVSTVTPVREPAAMTVARDAQALEAAMTVDLALMTVGLAVSGLRVMVVPIVDRAPTTEDLARTTDAVTGHLARMTVADAQALETATTEDLAPMTAALAVSGLRVMAVRTAALALTIAALAANGRLVKVAQTAHLAVTSVTATLVQVLETAMTVALAASSATAHALVARTIVVRTAQTA
jgi:hypothetical protein